MPQKDPPAVGNPVGSVCRFRLGFELFVVEFGNILNRFCARIGALS